MAFQGTMTIGVAVPIILAAVGVGIAGIKAAVGMSKGGVVNKPTLALVGEAGPEIVIPLKQYEEQIQLSRAKAFESLIKGSGVVKFDSGGVAYEPTYALIAESHPEVVAPLSSVLKPSVYPQQTIKVDVYIGEINAPADYEHVKESVLDAVSEAVMRRRGT
jgi:SLT domain-containing protein